jgi:hypothetical protein
VLNAQARQLENMLERESVVLLHCMFLTCFPSLSLLADDAVVLMLLLSP